MDSSHTVVALAKEARRLLFSKSPAAAKHGRGITSRPPRELARLIGIRIGKLGGGRRWQLTAVDAVTKWVLDRSDHAETTSALLEKIEDTSTRPEHLFVLSQTLCSLGLFETGQTIEARARRLFALELARSTSSRSMTKRLQLAIHEPSTSDALALLEKIPALMVSPALLPSSQQQLARYALAWLSQKDSRPASLYPTRWEEDLSGASVVIYGPGNVPEGTPQVKDSEVVARIAGPGSYSWGPEADLAQGRTNIVYVIPETLAAIEQSDENLTRIFGDYDFLCIKRGEASYIPNSRRVEGGSLLFISGHPNMVPLAVIDIVSIPGSSVRVIGSDFFASGSSYRPDSVRTTPDGRPQTSQGSTGNSYDRCTLMASHNAFQNRRLVKNLVDSGRVSGDEAFLEACSLSDLDYARRLDLHYGKHKL